MRDLKGYHACFDAVAREREHLGSVAAPSLKGSRGWLRAVLDAKCPFLVATEGRRIVGWCDVAPREMEGFRHTGGLGMGLVPEMRGRGLGARLLREGDRAMPASPHREDRAAGLRQQPAGTGALPEIRLQAGRASRPGAQARRQVR